MPYHETRTTLPTRKRDTKTKVSKSASGPDFVSPEMRTNHETIPNGWLKARSASNFDFQYSNIVVQTSVKLSSPRHISAVVEGLMSVHMCPCPPDKIKDCICDPKFKLPHVYNQAPLTYNVVPPSMEASPFRKRLPSCDTQPKPCKMPPICPPEKRPPPPSPCCPPPPPCVPCCPPPPPCVPCCSPPPPCVPCCSPPPPCVPCIPPPPICPPANEMPSPCQLPPPCCESKPQCLNCMLGYYYYPYGTWIGGPLHVTHSPCSVGATPPPNVCSCPPPCEACPPPCEPCPPPCPEPPKPKPVCKCKPSPCPPVCCSCGLLECQCKPSEESKDKNRRTSQPHVTWVSDSTNVPGESSGRKLSPRWTKDFEPCQCANCRTMGRKTSEPSGNSNAEGCRRDMHTDQPLNDESPQTKVIPRWSKDFTHCNCPKCRESTRGQTNAALSGNSKISGDCRPDMHRPHIMCNFCPICVPGEPLETNNGKETHCRIYHRCPEDYAPCECARCQAKVYESVKQQEPKCWRGINAEISKKYPFKNTSGALYDIINRSIRCCQESNKIIPMKKKSAKV